jgi:hypothetical protein
MTFRCGSDDARTAPLPGIDAEQQLLVPEPLQPLLSGATTWAGRALELKALVRALQAFVDKNLSSTQGHTVTWDANDEDQIDIDIGLPLLLLARDLRALGLAPLCAGPFPSRRSPNLDHFDRLRTAHWRTLLRMIAL